MNTRIRHSQAEIAVKLAKADALLTIGMRRQEVARTLGISAMTYYRWRKANPMHRELQSTLDGADSPQSPPSDGFERVADLELENSKLRRLVTDLLLERIKLEWAGPPNMSRTVIL
jgi:transposase-like protein